MEAKSVVATALFCCLLITASVWDIRKREIPDTLNILIFLTGLLIFTPEKLIGLLLGLPLLIAGLIKLDGIGGGDVKLTAATGFVLGIAPGTLGLILGLSSAVLFHLIIQGIRKLKRIKTSSARETPLPMAPFLSAGFMTAHFINLGGFIL